MARKFTVGQKVRFAGVEQWSDYHPEYRQLEGVVGEVVKVQGNLWPYDVRFPGLVTEDNTDVVCCGENELEEV